MRKKSNFQYMLELVRQGSQPQYILQAFRRRYPDDNPTILKHRVKLIHNSVMARLELERKDPEIKPVTPKFLRFVFDYDLRASLDEKLDDCGDTWTVFVNCARNLAHAVHPDEGFVLRAKLPGWNKTASDSWVKKSLTERLFKRIIF